LEWSKGRHTFILGGKEGSTTRPDASQQGEASRQPHQDDPNETQELCKETICGHFVLLSWNKKVTLQA
jgi:hypothetical protein